MRFVNRRALPWLLLAGVALGATNLYGVTVLHMGLEELCDRAGRIFRGEVVDIRKGRVNVGGSELPTMTYTVRVDETFKGDIGTATDDVVKGDVTVIEITMLGTLKRTQAAAGVQHFSPMPTAPPLKLGQDYLLVITTPSGAGLLTTVGLNQGAFKIDAVGEEEMAANELNNLGLFDGPVPYTKLAQEIRIILGQQGTAQ